MAALMEGFWIGIGRELDGEALRDRELLLRRPRLLGIEASEAGLMRRPTAPDQAMQAAATMESLSLFFLDKAAMESRLGIASAAGGTEKVTGGWG
ncbi:Os02g0466801 [Oryza sativa Japonica Group]|nr:Os02g0466801 [Oryza sativa Japonica Group]